MNRGIWHTSKSPPKVVSVDLTKDRRGERRELRNKFLAERLLVKL
jgi:hypothetical protein